jgi:hypothetical protein
MSCWIHDAPCNPYNLMALAPGTGLGMVEALSSQVHYEGLADKLDAKGILVRR